jgi:hypothetical protein
MIGAVSVTMRNASHIKRSKVDATESVFGIHDDDVRGIDGNKM